MCKSEFASTSIRTNLIKPCWNYRIGIHSESIRTIPIYSDIIPNQSKKRFVSRLIKNGQKSIRLNLINSETSIRINPKPSFQSRSIRINPSSEWSKPNFQSESIRIIPTLKLFGLIWIENLVSDWFGFIRNDVSELTGLSRIYFLMFFIKRDTKRFSDWFGMIRIGSDIDMGMNRNSSDSLGMNFNPILSPGKFVNIARCNQNKWISSGDRNSSDCLGWVVLNTLFHFIRIDF